MPNFTLNQLKQIAKMRRIKGYNNVSKERSLGVLDGSESLDNAKIRGRFLKPKIKEMRKNLCEIENKNLSESKTNEIEKNLFELEESFSRLIKCHDYGDAEYEEIRDVENLFNQWTDEDYYKPIKTKSAFNSNYIKYESNKDKDKNLSVKNSFAWSDHI